MNFTFFNLEGFKKLQTEKEQLKELFYIYGVIVSRLAILDDLFINMLRTNKFEFEGKQVGKTHTQQEIEKFEAHYTNKATLGMLIKDFQEKFVTVDVDDLLDELLRVRNVVAHSYMRLNWEHIPNNTVRVELYDDLLGVFKFLNQFDEAVKGKTFYTKKNGALGALLKG